MHSFINQGIGKYLLTVYYVLGKHGAWHSWWAWFLNSCLRGWSFFSQKGETGLCHLSPLPCYLAFFTYWFGFLSEHRSLLPMHRWERSACIFHCCVPVCTGHLKKYYLSEPMKNLIKVELYLRELAAYYGPGFQ